MRRTLHRWDGWQKVVEQGFFFKVWDGIRVQRIPAAKSHLIAKVFFMLWFICLRARADPDTPHSLLSWSTVKPIFNVLLWNWQLPVCARPWKNAHLRFPPAHFERLWACTNTLPTTESIWDISCNSRCWFRRFNYYRSLYLRFHKNHSFVSF